MINKENPVDLPCWSWIFLWMFRRKTSNIPIELISQNYPWDCTPSPPLGRWERRVRDDCCTHHTWVKPQGPPGPSAALSQQHGRRIMEQHSFIHLTVWLPPTYIGSSFILDHDQHLLLDDKKQGQYLLPWRHLSSGHPRSMPGDIVCHC